MGIFGPVNPIGFQLVYLICVIFFIYFFYVISTTSSYCIW